jgi:DNA-binding MarR family transcriptional regulator
VGNYTTAREPARDELAAWRGFLRAHTALTRALDAELVTAHGLALTSYEVLLYLDEAPAGKMRMAELADSALLSRSGLTRLADRLARDGLVERRPCSEDARGWFVALTPSGRDLLEQARATHRDGVRRLFADALSEGELQALGDCLERLAARQRT